MKKILNTFTFWFILISGAEIILSLKRIDDINLFMIGFNPILNVLNSSTLCHSIGNVPYLWHILSLVTMALYGIVIDCFIKKRRK